MKARTTGDQPGAPEMPDATPAEPLADPVEAIRAEYTRAVGPIGHVLLDEMLAELGPPPESCPRGRLPELIEKLSWEIHSERRRVQFQKAALHRLQYGA